MSDTERQLKMTKAMLRSTLISSKEGIPANTLLRDYEEITGEPLPFKSLGFSSLKEFILSIPDVVDVRRNAAGQTTLHAVACESNKHILDLVVKQKSKRNKKLSQINFGSKNEVPPRFLRQQVLASGGPSLSNGDSGGDGQQDKKYVYIDMYRVYCKKNGLAPGDFKTYYIKGSGFISMIDFNGETYGSEEFFPKEKEAEDAAAKSAVQSLWLVKNGAKEHSVASREVSNHLDEELLTIKNIMKQLNI